LLPGQQSKTAANGKILTGKVDAGQYIAWMNGLLPLNSMDIKSFLREVARWYDVDIVYEGEPPVLSFSGALDKEVPISQILSALNANGIHCVLKDKTVIVSGGL
jgi:ferric-dicitrate binding protein FerR (iron transport regulator)